MIEEIINKNLKRIEHDLEEIEGIQKIDFIDLFPINPKHRESLDHEALKIAKIIDKTDRGNYYLLNTPLKTKYGDLRLFKVRFYDETRTNWEAAADFLVEDRKKLEEKALTDSRFTYITRPKWDAIEFRTNNTLIYFLKPLISELYSDVM